MARDLKPDRAGGAEAWLGFLLSKNAERLRTSTAAELEPFGLSPKELGALETIAGRGPLSQAELSRHILVDRTTIVHLVDRLAAAGWIVRSPKSGDRRSHALTMTPEGQRRLDHARAAAAAVEADFSKSLSADELAALKAALARLLESFRGA